MHLPEKNNPRIYAYFNVQYRDYPIKSKLIHFYYPMELQI